MTRSAFPEFLAEEKAQHFYNEINFEYPVNPTVSKNEELAIYGRFPPAYPRIQRLTVLAPRAPMIIECVGW